jgi:hypothetical protein
MWSYTLQISWKQRFFVPIEEERGNAVIAALLEQFPVIATEDKEGDCHLPSDFVAPSANATQPVDLESWIIEPPEARRSIGVAEQQPIGLKVGNSGPTSDESEPTCTHPSQSASLPNARQASPPAMLQTLPPDYRAPAIQIGFNFAESES